MRSATSVDDLTTRTPVLEAASRKAFSRVGLVRYNPFEETGGNQSFALALLDASGDGWVLSSLHARSGTRVYAKAIAGGRSDAALSEEETAGDPPGQRLTPDLSQGPLMLRPWPPSPIHPHRRR